MYVCICRAVTARQISEAVEGGASSVDEVSWETGAATNCGSCLPSVEAHVEDCLRRCSVDVGSPVPMAVPAPL